MAYKHLRYRVADRWEYNAVRFIGKRFIQVRIIHLIDGLADSRLRIAKYCQSVVFCFIQAGISDRHTAGAETLGPIIWQPLR